MNGPALSGGGIDPVVVRPGRKLARRIESVLSWVVVATILAIVAAPVAVPKLAIIQRGAGWGLVVLVSMAGWGRLVARLTGARACVDLGLTLAWGAAIMLAAGGFLCLWSVATRPVLLALILGGVVLTLVDALRSARQAGTPALDWIRLWPWAAWGALLALAVLAGVNYFAGAAGSILNLNDDHAAYLVFPRKILATGTLVDPFSLRRLTAYGGHSFLQALTLVGAGSPLQVSILDLGLSLIIVLALLLGALSANTPRGLRGLYVLPVLFIVTLPNIRVNSASEMSGVVFFLALYRTATWKGFTERPFAGGVILALLAAGACTLRLSYLVPTAVFMAVLYLPSARAAVDPGNADRRRRLIELGIASATLLLFLFPWALLSYRSNRTFLFPLVDGNYRPEYGGLTTHSSWADRAKFFWTNACHCFPVRSLPFFILSGILIPWRRTKGALPALLWASLAGFASVVYSLPLSDEWNVARYYFGFTVAMVLAVMLAALATPWTDKGGKLRAQAIAPAMLVLAAIVSQVQDVRSVFYPNYVHLGEGIAAGRAHPSPLADHGAEYRKLQASVPRGAPLLVMLDESFWFDFSRNRIDLIDLPGAVSPPPGMPLDDDESLVRYLIGQGYRYLAFVRSDGSKSLYQRSHWAKMLTNPEAIIWQLSARFYLNTFDRFESLMNSRVRLYDDGRMVALDLEARAKH